MATLELPADLAQRIAELIGSGKLTPRIAEGFQDGVDTFAGLHSGDLFVNKTDAKTARERVFRLLGALRDHLSESFRSDLVAPNDGPVMDLYYTFVDSIPSMGTWTKRARAAMPHVSAPCRAELESLVRWIEFLQTVMNKDAMAKVGSGVDPATKAAKAEARRLAELESGKTVMTCPCCLRGIAIRPDHRMHHHGYERPGLGYQTASCMGIGYLPLEESVEGAQVVAAHLAKRETNLELAIKTAPKLRTLLVRRSFPKVGGKSWQSETKVVQIDRTDAEWKQQYTSHVATLRRELGATIEERAAFDAIVAAWHPGMAQTEAVEIAHRARTSHRREAA